MSPSDDLRHFWWRAEYQEPIFAADEVKLWPPGQLEGLRGIGLLREWDPSPSVTCFNCTHPHAAAVFYLNQDLFGRSRPHIMCPYEGLIEVDFAEMRQWLVDRRALVQAIRAALETAGHVEEIVPNRVWALGRRHLAGRFREFFFAAGISRPDGPTVLAEADRIGSAASPVILVPSKSPRNESRRDATLSLFCLSEIANIEGRRLTLDVAYIEDALRDRSAGPAKAASSFVVPDGAEWGDLTLVVGDTTLTAVTRGARKERSLEDCGFTRGHGDGDMALRVLRFFAHQRGSFSTRDIPAPKGEKTPFSKQVSMLRKQLKILFPIEGEPIVHHKSSGRYQCGFHVSLDTDPCFPTGESWMDYRFEVLDGGRISVGIKTREVFRAHERAGGEGRSPEVAVADARRWMEYPLERLGLADKSDMPTAEGQILLALLRSEGRLRRKPDDMAVLRLGQHLRNLSGIADDPLQYSDRKGLWIALFECGAARSK